MATQLQLRRGTTSETGSFTGAVGEVSVDTTKDTLVVHDGSTAGGHEMAKADGSNMTAIDVGDSVKLKMGNSDDLEIYHDGSDSYIKESGTGALNILGQGQINLKNSAGDETLASFLANNRVDLYYDNEVKISTTSGGVDVTGSLSADGAILSGNLELNYAYPRIKLTDTDHNSDYSIINNNGEFGIFDDTNNAYRLNVSASGDVSIPSGTMGIGDTPVSNFAVTANLGYRSQAALPNFTLVETDSSNQTWQINSTGAVLALRDMSRASDRLTIDTAGNVSVPNGDLTVASGNVSIPNEVYVGHNGNTAPWTMSGSQKGISLMGSSGFIGVARANGEPLLLNRTSSDGAILNFRKDGTTVGSIGSYANLVSYIALDPRTSGVNGAGLMGGSVSSTEGMIQPTNGAGAKDDDAINLGASNYRFKDLYLTNSTIQTSDRNEKQDIEELSDAEQRVAVAAKGLLRKFRWKSAVEKKGDDARIHFGIIAQDLQAAFEAEGLDAGRYGMFTSNTWWEHDVEVPAVEAVEGVEGVAYVAPVEAVEYVAPQDAVLDEDGNVVTEAVEEVMAVEAVEEVLAVEYVEAVEAADAYTRTDTYDTAEEAPEGSVEKTRMGVRYSELLAFIISAI